MTVNLETLRELIINNTKYGENDVYIKDIWLDYGAGISGETIVINNDNSFGGYQALSLREQENGVKGTMMIEDAQRIIDEINKRGW